MRRILLVILAAGMIPGPIGRAADLDRPAARTGKERLSGKASDEQRVDDCKVAPGQRTRPRPTRCPWDAGS